MPKQPAGPVTRAEMTEDCRGAGAGAMPLARLASRSGTAAARPEDRGA